MGRVSESVGTVFRLRDLAKQSLLAEVKVYCRPILYSRLTLGLLPRRLSPLKMAEFRFQKNPMMQSDVQAL